MPSPPRFRRQWEIPREPWRARAGETRTRTGKAARTAHAPHDMQKSAARHRARARNENGGGSGGVHDGGGVREAFVSNFATSSKGGGGG